MRHQWLEFASLKAAKVCDYCNVVVVVADKAAAIATSSMIVDDDEPNEPNASATTTTITTDKSQQVRRRSTEQVRRMLAANKGINNSNDESDYLDLRACTVECRRQYSTDFRDLRADCSSCLGSFLCELSISSR